MAKGYTVGLLEQEPQLDRDKTVIEVVREAVQPIVDLLARFDEVNAKFAEPDADFDALIAEQAHLQEAARQGTTPGTWTATWSWPWTPCAARRRRRRSRSLSGGERRRVALTPPAADRARHPAARRAHQPPRRRVGGLAGAPPARLQGHGHRRHPRPLLPRQRGRLDPGAGPRLRHPLEGQLLLVAGAEEGARCAGGEDRVAGARRPSSASWSGSACRPRRARPRARRASTAYEKLLSPGSRAATAGAGDLHPARPAAGRHRDRVRQSVTKAYGDRLLLDDFSVQHPAGLHRRA